LVQAIQDIPEDIISLDIYGQSNDDGYEALWRKNTEGKKNIHWVGKLEQKDVISTLQQYDVLCLCSTFSEMSPLVIQEAFAAGIPVVASNVYGNAEQVQNEVNGLLFTYKNVSSLKEQLLRLIKQPGLLKRLKENVVTPPNVHEQGITEYLRIYNNLVTS